VSVALADRDDAGLVERVHDALTVPARAEEAGERPLGEVGDPWWSRSGTGCPDLPGASIDYWHNMASRKPCDFKSASWSGTCDTGPTVAPLAAPTESP
jgi:hypothetical protein